MNKPHGMTGQANHTKEVVRDVSVNLRVYSADKAKWKEAAASEGVKLAPWVEKVLNAEVEK